MGTGTARGGPELGSLGSLFWMLRHGVTVYLWVSEILIPGVQVYAEILRMTPHTAIRTHIYFTYNRICYSYLAKKKKKVGPYIST